MDLITEKSENITNSLSSVSSVSKKLDLMHITHFNDNTMASSGPQFDIPSLYRNLNKIDNETNVMLGGLSVTDSGLGFSAVVDYPGQTYDRRAELNNTRYNHQTVGTETQIFSDNKDASMFSVNNNKKSDYYNQISAKISTPVIDYKFDNNNQNFNAFITKGGKHKHGGRESTNSENCTTINTIESYNSTNNSHSNRTLHTNTKSATEISDSPLSSVDINESTDTISQISPTTDTSITFNSEKIMDRIKSTKKHKKRKPVKVHIVNQAPYKIQNKK